MAGKFTQGAFDLFNSARGYNRQSGFNDGARSQANVENSLSRAALNQVKTKDAQRSFDEMGRLLEANPDIASAMGVALRNSNPQFKQTIEGFNKNVDHGRTNQAIDSLKGVGSGIYGVDLATLAKIRPQDIDSAAVVPSKIAAFNSLAGTRDAKTNETNVLLPKKENVLDSVVGKNDSVTGLNKEKLKQLTELFPILARLNENKADYAGLQADNLEGLIPLNKEKAQSQINLLDEQTQAVLEKTGPQVRKLLADAVQSESGKKTSGDAKRSLFTNLLEMVNGKDITGQRPYSTEEAIKIVQGLGSKFGFDFSGLIAGDGVDALSGAAGSQQPSATPATPDPTATPLQGEGQSNQTAFQKFMEYLPFLNKPVVPKAQSQPKPVAPETQKLISQTRERLKSVSEEELVAFINKGKELGKVEKRQGVDELTADAEAELARRKGK